jgi:hypothetical protein
LRSRSGAGGVVEKKKRSFVYYYCNNVPDTIRVEHILAEFGPELRRRAVSDGLIRVSGLIYYVITVLVPELAVMLIQEDMKVCDETARHILQSVRIWERHCMMMYKVYFCSDASSMLEMYGNSARELP